MALNLIIGDDDPNDPIDRLAFAMNKIGDLQKAAKLQQSIIEAHVAGDDDVRLVGAQDAFERISRDIEKLTASIQGVANSLGVNMTGRPAYGRITIDGE